MTLAGLFFSGPCGLLPIVITKGCCSIARVQNGQEIPKILLNQTVDNFGKYASLFGVFCRIFKNTPKGFSDNYEEPVHLFAFFTVFHVECRQE
jgi:hypothetical protein